MPISKRKICPRCLLSFDCNFQDIQNCQCTTVSISPATKADLEKNYKDCLCKNCLMEMENNTLKSHKTIQ